MKLHCNCIEIALKLHIINRVYQQECYQDLRERRDNKPLFHGEKFMEHYQREIDEENCAMIFNNSIMPNLVWPGELANEQQNELFKKMTIYRGKYGFLRAYEHLDLLSNMWNRRMLNYYSNPKNIDQVKKLDFSHQLFGSLQDLVQYESNCGNMMQIIKQKGMYNKYKILCNFNAISLQFHCNCIAIIIYKIIIIIILII